MHLTDEQKQAIESGEAVPLTADGIKCVLIREDVFDQIKESIDPRSMYPAILKAWDADDENPEQYQGYLRDS